MHELHFLQDLLVLFGLGVVAVVLFHRANLPPVLGFLLTGVLCGPFGFKLIDNSQGIETLAEIGLVLLLFTIGIEFSVKTFLRLKKFLLIAGGLQVAVTLVATMLISHVFGVPWSTATFLGMLVSLSSTAIVIRILEYRGELETAQGRSALSILIFQDLLIVPFVLLTPFLGGKGGTMADVGWLSGKALVFVVLAATVARYVVPWLLNQVAKTRKREAFVLSIILLCLGTATATSHVGLSMALGAFIAGLVISDSKYNHQALSEVLPFREVFNCLVFVSIGMLFDVRALLDSPLIIAGTLVAVLALKAVVAAGATLVMGHSIRVALLTGLALAQISEFSFVLSKVGLEAGIIDAQTNQIFLAVAILSMALTPALLGSGTKLATWAEKLFPRWSGSEVWQKDEVPSDHVVIVGYGTGGRHLARVLKEVGIRYVIIEHDPLIVRSERLAGTPIFYGDAGRQEVLHFAGLDRARVLALTISDGGTTLRSAELARRLNPSVHIIARARYMDEVEKLVSVGAHEVVPEEFVGSIEIFSRVLQRYMIPRDVLDRCIDGVKLEGARTTEKLFELHRPGEGMHCVPCELSLEVHRVEAGSKVAHKALVDCHLRSSTGTTVVAIQRKDGNVVLNPRSHDVIEPDDALILLGKTEQLAAAARLFKTEETAK